MSPRTFQPGEPLSLEASGPLGVTAVDATLIGATATRILVSLPGLHSCPETLYAGVEVSLRCIDSAGVHSARSKVRAVRQTSPVTLSLDRPTRVETKQSRKSFRVPAAVAFLLDASGSSNPAARQMPVTECRSSDISAGGICFDTTIPLLVGDHVEVTLAAAVRPEEPLTPPITFAARVLRVRRIGGKEPRSAVAVEYLSPKNVDRERLVRFLFKLERALRTV